MVRVDGNGKLKPFVKIIKKFVFFLGGGGGQVGGGGGGGGVRCRVRVEVDVNGEVKIL